jgi:prepilin-type N-terminal cleavage/methylation domain-containing protein
MRAIPVPFGAKLQEERAECGNGSGSTGDGGFTLVEMLVAIVLVGILTAVALVTLNGLNGNGSKAACTASRDAASAASLTYYANFHGNYPQTFDDLTNPPSGNPLLDASNVTVTSPTTLTGKGGWVLTMHPGATVTDRTWFGC